MTNPTNPGDVEVTGHRQRGTGWPRETVVVIEPLPGNHDEKPTLQAMEEQQCSIIRNKRIWNADAAASNAVPQMQAYALTNNWGFWSREHGVALIRSGDNVVLGTIDHGVAGAGEMTIPTTGVTLQNFMGFIHTHPGGTGFPSDDDWDAFLAYVNHPSNASRPEIDYIAMYVVVPDLSRANGYRIHAYTRHSSRGYLGVEVDPNGQSCP